MTTKANSAESAQSATELCIQVHRNVLFINEYPFVQILAATRVIDYSNGTAPEIRLDCLQRHRTVIYKYYRCKQCL